MKQRNKIKLRPKQQIAMEYLTNPMYKDIRDIGYGGSAGGGKSILGSSYLIGMAMKYPNTRYAAAAYDIKKAEDTMGISINETLEMMDLKPDIDYTYNVKRHTYTFLENGSEIILFGLTYKPNDPQNLWLGGYLFTCSWIDESNAVDSRVIDTFTSRNGRYGNEVFVKADEMTDEEKEENSDWEIKGGYNKVKIYTKILQTFNPSQNHVYTQFWLPYKNKKQKESRFVRAFAWDNYDKDSQYVNNLKKLRDRTTRERLLYGSFEFNASDAALFDSDAVKWMCDNKVEQTKQLFMVVDVADAGTGNDKTTIGYFDGFDCYEIEDFEYEHSDDLVKHILLQLRKRRIPIGNLIVDGNGSGSYVVKDSRLKGSITFKAHFSPVKYEISKTHTDKKNKNRISSKLTSTYRTLKDQCTMILAEKVNDQLVTASFVSTELKDELKQELLIYEHINIGTDRPIEVTKKSHIRAQCKRSPDVSDLFMMLMYPYLLDSGIKKAKPIAERKFITRKTIKNNYA